MRGFFDLFTRAHTAVVVEQAVDAIDDRWQFFDTQRRPQTDLFFRTDLKKKKEIEFFFDVL